MNLDSKVMSILKSRGSSPSPTKSSPGSTNKTKVKISNDIFIMDSIKALSQEMHHHIKSSRLQTVNEKIHSIINGIHKDEKQQIKIAQEGILDLDIVTGKNTKKYHKRRNMSFSNKKSKNKSKQKNNYKNLNTSLDTIQSQKVSFYDRAILNKNKKEYEVEALRNQMREELKDKFTEKPTLTNNTLRIMEARKNKPLYLRTQEVLMIKNAKLENLKQERMDIEKLENSNIHQKHNLSHQITENSKESMTIKEKSDQFFNSQISWKKKISNKTKLAQLEKINQSQIEESSMFKPTINKTSEILVSLKTLNAEESDQGNLTTYDRLYHRHEEHLEKMKKKVEEPICSFNPKINKNKLTHIKAKVYDNSKTNTITSKQSTNRNNPAKGKENENVKKMNSSTLENTSLSRIAEYSPSPCRVGSKISVSSEARSTMYLKRSSWENKLENVNKRNKNKNSPRRKSKNTQNSMDHLYKLNIRSGSALDISNENVIKLNPKFKSMLDTLLD